MIAACARLPVPRFGSPRLPDDPADPSDPPAAGRPGGRALGGEYYLVPDPDQAPPATHVSDRARKEVGARRPCRSRSMTTPGRRRPSRSTLASRTSKKSEYISCRRVAARSGGRTTKNAAPAGAHRSSTPYPGAREPFPDPARGAPPRSHGRRASRSRRRSISGDPWNWGKCRAKSCTSQRARASLSCRQTFVSPLRRTSTFPTPCGEYVTRKYDRAGRVAPAGLVLDGRSRSCRRTRPTSPGRIALASKAPPPLASSPFRARSRRRSGRRPPSAAALAAG